MDERIENAALVELLGKIREDNSEKNMIALLKEAASSRFIVAIFAFRVAPVPTSKTPEVDFPSS